MKVLSKDQNTNYVELLAAEAKFLSGFGWRPSIPVALGAPMMWKDSSAEGETMHQDRAVEKQKMRVVDILYRD